jgi:hypothetical protein
MYETIGSAGMLRGWVDLWTTHTLLLLATLTVSVGIGALVELITERRRAVQDRSVSAPHLVPLSSVPP